MGLKHKEHPNTRQNAGKKCLIFLCNLGPLVNQCSCLTCDDRITPYKKIALIKIVILLEDKTLAPLCPDQGYCLGDRGDIIPFIGRVDVSEKREVKSGIVLDQVRDFLKGLILILYYCAQRSYRMFENSNIH
jgi:hypothetical protein